MADNTVRVRYAPSPTGYLHIGGLRTALYNELFARRHGGVFLLRIEDTDRTRFVEGGMENICRSLKACGVVPSEGVWIDDDGKVVQRGEHGPYIQSERKERHLAYAEQLLGMGKAYYCFCTAERLEELRKEQEAMHQPTMYDGHCRALADEEAKKRVEAGEKHVIRLKLPKEGVVDVDDVIRGRVSFEWKLIDDQVIIKSDGFPTYHLAAMCDDHDMEITHVLRGEEWITSTPKHLFIFESFGWTAPKFAHLPLLLNPDRSKLSKRQGDVAVEDYLAKGYLPEALVNFVALLGWNPSGEQEIYTHEELGERFELDRVNKAGAIFNTEKLDWLNVHYLRVMSVDRYLELTRPFAPDASDPEFRDRCLLLVRDRIVKPQDAAEHIAPFIAAHHDYSAVSLTWKTQPKDEARTRIAAVRDLLVTLPDEELADVQTVEKYLKGMIAERGWGNGDTLWPTRVALSGQEKSPSPFELISVYGKPRSLARLDDALKYLEA